MEPGELLAKGDIDGFNKLRRQAGRLDLFAADLAGLSLRGVDLSGVNLDKADLTDADLTGGRLARAFASEIDASGVRLCGVLGLMVKMKDAILDGADLGDADLSRADLSGSQLDGATGEGVKLVAARLKSIRATGVRWPRADLTEATLGDAVLAKADLHGAILKDASGADVDLQGADLRAVDAAGARLQRARLAGANLEGARLGGADLSDADLTGANLRGADLGKARLEGARLDSADLSGASLVDAVLDRVSAVGTVWGGADLTGVDVAGLGLSDETLSGLKGSGARYDADADVLYADAEVAVAAGVIGVAWLNPDHEEYASLRWAVRDARRHHTGIVPVSADALLAHTILPFQGAFAVVALVERGGGPALMRWLLGLDGVLQPPVVTSLGFEPAVMPVFEVVGEHVALWTLSRRGPSVVRMLDQGEGFQILSTESRPQAVGFVGSGPPALVCKAGVLVPLRGDTLGAPLRAPDGFPQKVSTVVALEDRVLVLWSAPKQGRDSGGVRYQVLGERLPREVEVWSKQAGARALTAVRHGDGVFAAWLERTTDGDVLALADQPGVVRDRFALPGDAEGLRLVRRAADAPAIAILMASGSLVVITPEGKEIGWFPASEVNS